MKDFAFVLLITIPWLIVTIAGAFAFIYWKHKKKEQDNETVAALLEIAAKQLVQLRMESQNTLDTALMRSEEVHQLLERNKLIYQENLAVLKQVQTENFYVRDCSIWIYEHFKNVNELIEKIPIQDGVNTVQLKQIKADAVNAMNIAATYYSNKFNRHPEDVLKEKQLITGTKKDGTKYIGGASIN
jgi:cbb3-type cytochrome oxidase subunit 3